MNSIPFETMSQILGIVLCCQDQLMIWLWISLSLCNNRIPCPLLLCCCLQFKGYEDKEKVFSVEHRYSPKLSYPECMILLWKVLSSCHSLEFSWRNCGKKWFSHAKISLLSNEYPAILVSFPLNNQMFLLWNSYDFDLNIEWGFGYIPEPNKLYIALWAEII